MMDRNDIDFALHEIEQMVLVAVGAQENLYRSEAAPEFFQMPAADCEMLSFAVFDVLKRVEALRAAMSAPALLQGA
jgi:hypothetical protein